MTTEYNITIGAVAVAPAAGAALVTLAGAGSNQKRVHGWYIMHGEAVAVQFEIRNAAAIVLLIMVPAGQSQHVRSPEPFFSGGAGNNVTINNTVVGTAGINYQAAIIWG